MCYGELLMLISRHFSIDYSIIIRLANRWDIVIVNFVSVLWWFCVFCVIDNRVWLTHLCHQQWHNDEQHDNGQWQQQQMSLPSWECDTFSCVLGIISFLFLSFGGIQTGRKWQQTNWSIVSKQWQEQCQDQSFCSMFAVQNEFTIIHSFELLFRSFEVFVWNC